MHWNCRFTVRSLLLALVVGVCLAGLALPAPDTGMSAAAENAGVVPPPPAAITRAIVLAFDGLRPDALRQADAPHVIGLAERGAVDWSAQTILPPVTLPAHASMLTGLSVEAHGLAHNNSVHPCTAISAPTFVTAAHEAGYRAAMVVGKEKLCQFHQTDAVDYTFARAGDRSVTDRVIELIAADFEVIFAHFPNADYFGHLNGWMSGIYLYEIGRSDEQVGRILAALDEHGWTDETLIILTADHGGHDFGHGLDIPEDRLIPWIVAGPGVTAGTTLHDITVADTAATVRWALNLPLLDGALGRPVFEAFVLST